jgi:hypothetical protein
MQRAPTRRLVAATVLGVGVVLLAVAGAGGEQGGGNNPASPARASGPVPRLANGKPDMTGVWGPGGAFPEQEALAELDSLYTPAAREKMKGLREADDPLFRCMPYGVPRSIISSPWPFQIVQRPDVTVVLTEYYHAFRIIPTTGTPRPEVLLPQYFGDSVGRWEGDTLVVDVTGFNGKTWLADARDRPTPTSTGIWLHSPNLHVVERWTMRDADTLEYQATLTDPEMLSKPYVSPRKPLRRQPFEKIGEGMCFDTTTYELTKGINQ